MAMIGIFKLGSVKSKPTQCLQFHKTSTHSENIEYKISHERTQNMNAKKDNPEKSQIMANLTFISHLHIIVPKGSIITTSITRYGLVKGEEKIQSAYRCGLVQYTSL
jgi:hypothetical protein